MQKVLPFSDSSGIAPCSWHLWRSILPILVRWRERHRSRQRLGQLDDRELADIGLSRAQQRHECRKRFWEG